MFTYCLNNPVICYDPSGNACIMTCHGQIDLFTRDLTDFGCGGGSVGGGGGSIKTRPNTSGVLSDHQESAYGGTSHGKILPWEFDFLNISPEGLTMVDFSASLLEGCYEWEDLELTLLELFSAEISAGATTEDGIHCSAMVSMVSSGVTWNCGFCEIAIVGYLGAIGGTVSVESSGFTFGYAPCGVGGEISISWDIE